jgi:hypothetical protein
MNELEQRLLREEIGDARPRLCIRSNTRIDAGLWWRRSPVWLCVAGDELILLAVARRRYVERIAIADCQASHYSHASGELVIEPGEALRISHLALSPRDALSVLDILKTDCPTLITKP